MPRPKRSDSNDDQNPAKRRSRKGCWPCKARKIKCGEERPSCLNCVRFEDACDYSIRLNWEGRSTRDRPGATVQTGAFVQYKPPASVQPTSTPSNKRSASISLPRVNGSVPPSALTTADTDPAVARAESPSSSSISTSPSVPNVNPSPVASYSQWPPQTPVEGAAEHFRTQKRRRLDSINSTGSASSVLPEVFGSLRSPSLFEDSPTLSAQADNSLGLTFSRSDGGTLTLEKPRILDSKRVAKPSLVSHARRDSSFTYGFDQGRPDLDVPRNDDAGALAVFSPSSALGMLQVDLCPGDDDHPIPEFGFGFHCQESEFRLDDYYKEAVPIQIPQSLEPLPAMLHRNPINLLYFHHFLNHTARILVPHDCPDNPFRNVLPRMALQDENLMGLLLAYSASHRARLLKHAEPKTRIAMWVSNVFPNLRLAISGKGPISDSSLATAIMQASLEIISPNAFEVPIAWQSYLQTARAMIIARGGFRALRDDHIAYFLSRWFGYLDMCGSLSGSSYDIPLTSDFELSEAEYGEAEAELDCMMGFTVGCTLKLAKVAALARKCDGERIGLDGSINKDWSPSTETVDAAEELRRKLMSPRPEVVKRCQHDHAGRDAVEARIDQAESTAVNDAYHWTGIIHLQCRVYGMNGQDREVQDAVQGIMECLQNIRRNSSAEACMVLPMFTAGCQVQRLDQRKYLMSRLLTVEQSGMSQVHRARRLMEQVWSSEKPWETLVTGEFVG